MRQKLKKLRQLHGHTQSKLAELSGTTKEYYGLIENGKRVGTLPFWLRLQKAYNLTDGELWAVAKEGVKFGRKSSTH